MSIASAPVRLLLLVVGGLIVGGLAPGGGARLPVARAQAPTEACTITWVAKSLPNQSPELGGSWDDPEHWDLGRVPGPGDHVCITLGGEYTVGAGTATIGDLTLQTPSGTATLDVGFAQLTVTGSVYSAERIIPGHEPKYYYPDLIYGFLAVGGTLTNHGLIESAEAPGSVIRGNLVNEADGIVRPHPYGYGVLFTKAGGTFVNRGLITTAPAGGISFSGAGGSFTQAGGSIQIETEGSFVYDGGTFSYTGGTIGGTPQLANARLVIGPGATPPSGAFKLYGAQTSLGSDLPAGFTLHLNNYYNWTFGIDADRTNYGTILLESTVVATAGHSLTNAPGAVIDVVGSTTLKGKLINQGTLRLQSSLRTSETSTYTNSGSIAIFPEGSLSIAGGAPAFSQLGGSIANSGSFSFANGTFDFAGGALSGIAPLLTNAHLKLGPSAGAGRLILTGTSARLSGEVRAGHELVVRDGTLTFASGLTNGGVIATAGDGGARLVSDDGVLTNTAQGTITTGTSGGGTRITGTVINRGTITINDSGAEAGLRFSTPGATFTNLGTLNIPPTRTLTIASGTLNLAGGSVIGGGTVRIDEGATLTGGGELGASLVNSGTLSPGAPLGQLGVGGSFTQTASGVLQVELSGSGTATTYDRLAVAGEATLGGTLGVRLVPGFQAAVGEQFPVLSYGARAGGSDFSAVSVSGAATVEPLLGAQGLSLRITGGGGDPGPAWLVLLYLAGDDVAPDSEGTAGLSDAVAELLTRLRTMPYNRAMRLVVLYDAAQVGDSRIYVREPDGLEDVTEAAARSSLWLGGMGGTPGARELNTGSVSTLNNFIAWARTTYAGSPYTMLSLVDHGGGWSPDLDSPAQPRGGVRVQAGSWRGTSLDLTSNSSLATRSLTAALRDQGLIDVFFLDACLMGMLENAYEVRANADYLVAGENLLFAGLPYQDYLAPEGLTATTTPRELALRIVERYNRDTSAALNPFTIAALDLRQLRDEVPDNLASRVGALAEGLLAALPAAPQADDPLVKVLTGVYSETQKFDYDSSLSLDPAEGYVDLVDFARRLRDTNDPGLPAAVREAAAAVVYAAVASETPVVLRSRRVSGEYEGQTWSFAGANGIAIFLPLGEQDYRPSLVDPAHPGQPARAERQLTYYTDRSQLAFADGVAAWGALLVRLEGAVPVIRTGPGGLPAALSAAARIDTRAFNTPFPLVGTHVAYLPAVSRP